LEAEIGQQEEASLCVRSPRPRNKRLTPYRKKELLEDLTRWDGLIFSINQQMRKSDWDKCLQERSSPMMNKAPEGIPVEERYDYK
jgi:hypothetical protein